MKNNIFIFTLIFMSLNFSAIAQVNSDVEEVEALPGITELPVLNLSDTSSNSAQTLGETDFLNRDSSSQTTHDTAVEDEIPTAQQELIERLKYKKKEGSKKTRFKPDVRISAVDNRAGTSWGDKD